MCYLKLAEVALCLGGMVSSPCVGKCLSISSCSRQMVKLAKAFPGNYLWCDVVHEQVGLVPPKVVSLRNVGDILAERRAASARDTELARVQRLAMGVDAPASKARAKAKPRAERATVGGK